MITILCFIVAIIDVYLIQTEKYDLPVDLDAFFSLSDQPKAIFSSLALCSIVIVAYLLNKLFGVDPLGRTFELFGKFAVQEGSRKIKVKNWIQEYNDLHDDDSI